jgi:hypothetical protein
MQRLLRAPVRVPRLEFGGRTGPGRRFVREEAVQLLYDSSQRATFAGMERG